jgi:hypothetical protein
VAPAASVRAWGRELQWSTAGRGLMMLRVLSTTLHVQWRVTGSTPHSWGYAATCSITVQRLVGGRCCAVHEGRHTPMRRGHTARRGGRFTDNLSHFPRIKKEGRTAHYVGYPMRAAKGDKSQRTLSGLIQIRCSDPW